ncbi:MAG: XdhC family protein [Chitinophagaceae bacterium]|nr:XdhC family protein [Chitinophagaceae bacterium]
MHKQLPSWQLIHESLQNDIAVMLLYVLQSNGSSPGRQGFMMAVNAAGAMSGSLGGGIMEHKFVELAKSKLLEAVTEIAVHQQIHDKSAAKNQSGMICSGEQTIFLYTVKKEEAAAIQNIIATLKENSNATLQLSPQGIFFSDIIPSENYQLQLKTAGDFLFFEKIGYKNKLYIVGGGHCSLSLSQLMSGMDFYTCIFDDRHELNTMMQNTFVQEKHLVVDYSALSTMIQSGSSTYVVIMTVGYRTDEMALKALLGKDFFYICMLGSKSKIAKMFEQLVAEGIDRAWLAKIHAPIGIPVKSQTPEEIAVSIAAEIISVKNSLL